MSPDFHLFRTVCKHVKHIITGNDIDYKSGTYIIMFPAGVTHVSLNINITKDNISESNETFYVAIEENSLPSKVTTDGAISQADVTITNNYGKLICVY